MIRYLLTEVVALGKEKEDKAYREKVQPILERYGLTETVWRVDGRRQGQILVDFGEYESREAAEAKIAQVDADAEWVALQEERGRLGTIVPGTGEFWVLTDC